MSKVVNIVKVLLIIVIIGAAIGLYIHNDQHYATRNIKGEVNLDGYGVSVNCIGKGNPTVIFESGLNEGYRTWVYTIQEEISKITRTFSYNRMGFEYSDKEKANKSCLTQVNKLHQLLKNAKVKGPYVIVAHSIGGFNARLFAATYPQEVVGIVFVDCSHENQQWDGLSVSDYSELSYEDIIRSSEEVRESRDKDVLRNIPIVVLTADYKNREPFEGMFNYWINYQNSLAELSNKSKHIIVKDCGHMIQEEHPEAVIKAIKDILEALEK